MSAELERVINEARYAEATEDIGISDAVSDASPLTNRRPQRLLLSLGVVAALALIVGWLTHRPAGAPPAGRNPAAVPVVLAAAQRTNLRDYVGGIGTVQASASATVRVRVDGQLQRVSFVEGQDVTAGEVLAQIDPAALHAQVQLAEAQLARDQAALNNARADLKRYSDSVQKGSVAQQAVDTQRAVVAQGEATVAADQAQVDYARVQLSYATIRAPFSGRTGVRLVDAGNLVRASEATGIVVINQIDPVTLSFTLPEDQFTRVNAAIHQHNAGALTVQAVGEDEQLIATGKLLLLNNQIDTSSGTIQLKAVFDNREHQLWPGQYLNARLLLGETRDALVIPAAAVQRGPDGTFVYVRRADNTAAVRNIKVARLQEDQAVIAAGLQEHDVVVVTGQSKLRPGAAIVEQHVLADAGQSK